MPKIINEGGLGGRRPNRAGKSLAALAGLVLLAIAAALITARSNRAPALLPPPSVVLPRPNAFDFYNRAAAAIANTRQVAFAINFAGPGQTIDRKYYPIYSLGLKEMLLRQNQGALAALRQGLRYQCFQPPGYTALSSPTALTQSRYLARLLVLDEQVRLARGDRAGALDCLLDAFKFSDDIPRGANVVGMLYGAACQAVAGKSLWALVDRLDAAQSLRAARQLEGLEAAHYPFSETLKCEEYEQQRQFLAIFGKINPAQFYLAWQIGEVIRGHFKPFNATRNQILKQNRDYMDAFIAVANKPYTLITLPAAPTDFFNQSLLPVIARSRFHVSRRQAMAQLLAVSFALRAFRLERGRYPARLAELQPRYLKKIPIDAFGNGGEVRYRVQDGKYVLWSVGPDGVDDGGVAMNDSSVSRKNPHLYRETSKGDIVAGVNT